MDSTNELLLSEYKKRLKKLEEEEVRLDTIIKEKKLIKDADSYDPKTPTNEQLADDWRIVCAWYAILKDPKKKIKFSEAEIVKLGTTIVREIQKRVKKGSMKHEFDVEGMAPSSKELIKKIIPGLDISALNTTLPIFPGRISERHPDVIALEDFLCRFRDHYLRKPFVQVVGSLPNWGGTNGDIDILIKGEIEEKIVQIEGWRIKRAFPDIEDRLEILDDTHWHGPFTNFIDLADLKVEIRPNLFTQEMKRDPKFKASCEVSKLDDKLKVLRPFYQCKPTHGRNIGEIYSLDSVIEAVNKLWPEWEKSGIFVGKKCDGTTNQLHKKGDEVKLWSEDGSKLTENLPTIISQVQEISPHDFVVIGELEVWKNGKHQARAISAGVIGHKGDPDEKFVRFTLYDILFLEDDIHKETYAERRKKLVKFKDSDNIKVSRDEPLVRTEKDLRSQISRLRKVSSSEGAMLKLADKDYELDESTKWMIKFKNEYALNAKVLKRYKVKGSEDTYYYACALKDAPYTGKTFNTNLKLDPGKIIRVIFADISEYHDPELGTTWFNWWSPHVESARVVDKAKTLDTAKKAHELVLKTSGRIEEKKLPKFVRKIQDLSKITYEEESEIIRENKKKPEAQKPHRFKPAVWTFKNGHPRCLICGDEETISGICNNPDEGKAVELGTTFYVGQIVSIGPDSESKGKVLEVLEDKVRILDLTTKEEFWIYPNEPIPSKMELARKKFVLQHHWRGNSVHVDFRHQTDHILNGFTLNDAMKGVAEKYLKWKLDKSGKTIKLFWDKELFYEIEKKTEKVLQEPTKALKDKVYKISQDLEDRANLWKVDWKTGEEKKRETAAGSLRIEHQVLVDVDSPLELVEALKIWSAKKTKEPYEWLFAEGVTPPRAIEESPGGTRFYPGVFVTIDRGTYDLGAQKSYFKEFFLRGKQVKGRIVFRQVAGLKEAKGAFTWLYWKPMDQTPYVLSKRAVEKKWLPKEGSALPADLERKVPPVLVYWKKDLSEKEKLERRAMLVESLKGGHELGITKFILSRRWWKGQEVIRKLEFEDFHLQIKNRKFHLSENPEFKSSMSAVEFSKDPGYFKEGTYGPDSDLNPNKEIPVHVEIVDKDQVNIIEESNQSIKLIFDGKILKGDWIFFRSPPDEIWTFKKQTVPKTQKRGRPPLSDKEKFLIREVYRSTGSVNETRKQTGHGFQTIYDAIEEGN